MLRREILFFLFVGTCGFVIDAGGVYVLMHFYDASPVLIRIPALAIAIVCTFLLNRYFTFSQARAAPILSSFIKYVSANGLSQGLNFAVYATLVLASDYFRQMPIIAVFFGSLAAAIFSFFVYKFMVFKSHEQNS